MYERHDVVIWSEMVLRLRMKIDKSWEGDLPGAYETRQLEMESKLRGDSDLEFLQENLEHIQVQVNECIAIFAATGGPSS